MSYLVIRDQDGTVRVVDPTRNISETVKGATLKMSDREIAVPQDTQVAHFKAGVISNAA